VQLHVLAFSLSALLSASRPKQYKSCPGTSHMFLLRSPRECHDTLVPLQLSQNIREAILLSGKLHLDCGILPCRLVPCSHDSQHLESLRGLTSTVDRYGRFGLRAEPYCAHVESGRLCYEKGAPAQDCSAQLSGHQFCCISSSLLDRLFDIAPKT
jgi:hypothetical protein